MTAQRASGSRRGAARAAAGFGLLGSASLAWAAFAHLQGLPTVDGRGALLYLGYGLDRSWWSAVSFAIAATTSLAIVTWALIQMNRSAGRVGRSLAVAGSCLWLALTSGSILVLGVLALTSSTEGPRTAMRGPGGTTVLIRQDAFDGEIVGVWQQAGRFTYVREPGPVSVDSAPGWASPGPRP